MRGLRTPMALMLLTATFSHHLFVSSAAAGPYPPIGQSVSSGYSSMSPYPSIGHSVQPQSGPYPMLGHTVDQVSYEQTSCSPESLCDSCCDEVFCDPGPKLSARVKFIYMRRDENSDPGILRNTATNQVVLKGNDFDFDFQPGIDASVSSHLGYGLELEARYLWIDDWNAGVYVVNPVPGDLQLLSNPLSAGAFTDDMSSTYSSRLRTAEVNLKQSSGDVTWLIGFRWGEIDEDMQINSVGTAGQVISDFDTRNDLFGGQIGAEALLGKWGKFELGGFAKTGIYGNTAKGVSRLQLGPNVLGTARDKRTEPAIMSEAGLETVFWLTQSVNLRLGYQVFIAHGIAVAAEQVKKTGNLNPGGTNNIVWLGLDTSSFLFTHGGTGALEIVW
ncbi:MAG: hypothetical protein KDA86_16250 [Planctomycetaceae bacterium]|nr:hypothetical protein [Planctomycetaceae bacterium]